MTIAKPIVPGTVIRFAGDPGVTVEPGAADTVGLPIVHDWGPVGSDSPGTDLKQGGPQELTSFNQWTTLFGNSDTDGRTAVAGAFAGQGLPGAAGAGAVIVYRMAGSSVAAAGVTIHATGGGTPPGIALTAVYKGTRGNRFTYTIDVDPANSARDRLRLMLDGQVQETYVYAQTDVISLAAAINARSSMVSAVNNETSAARLVAGANVAFTAGNDGETLLPADHLSALDAIKMLPFGVLAPFNLTDSGVLASYVSWIQAQDAANRPVRMVCGGAAAEELDDALTRSEACADPHVINFGVGTYHDDLLDKDLSTAQLAPRIAGILAARGQTGSLTYCKIGGLHVVSATNASDDDVQTAVQFGVTVLMLAGASDADLRIAKGVTTYIGDTDALPQDVFGDPRLVGIMDNYTRSMKEWGDDTIIGDLPVNDDTRNLVRGQARLLEDDLLEAGLILAGDDVTIPKPWVVCEDPEDDSLRDAIPYTFGWQFALTANAILGEGSVR